MEFALSLPWDFLNVELYPMMIQKASIQKNKGILYNLKMGEGGRKTVDR